MPTIFTEGDLFTAKDIHAFAHGCNCAGAMGKGFAVEVKIRFPRMFKEYRQRCKDGYFQLGDVFEWHEGPQTIFNLGTQAHWKAPADLSALTTAIGTMVSLAGKQQIARVALPRIGAGFGGLDWKRVRPVLQAAGEDTPVKLVVFETYVPAPRVR